MREGGKILYLSFEFCGLANQLLRLEDERIRTKFKVTQTLRILHLCKVLGIITRFVTSDELISFLLMIRDIYVHMLRELHLKII